MDPTAAVDAVWGIGVLGALTEKLCEDFFLSLKGMNINEFEVRDDGWFISLATTPDGGRICRPLLMRNDPLLPPLFPGLLLFTIGSAAAAASSRELLPNARNARLLLCR